MPFGPGPSGCDSPCALSQSSGRGFGASRPAGLCHRLPGGIARGSGRVTLTRSLSPLARPVRFAVQLVRPVSGTVDGSPSAVRAVGLSAGRSAHPARCSVRPRGPACGTVRAGGGTLPPLGRRRWWLASSVLEGGGGSLLPHALSGSGSAPSPLGFPSGTLRGRRRPWVAVTVPGSAGRVPTRRGR